MGPNREGEADEASGINYPSPGADGLDAGPFYGSAHRDGAQEHHDGGEHQNGDGVHNDGVDDSHLQDADGTSHRPTNLEELQLAAQLGQGLAGTGILPSTDPNMSVDDSNMRNIMPHPDGDHQGSPYVHDTPTSDHMVQHGMQVGVGPLPPQYSLPDGIPPRKRSKVSRACDECRRKKIKCDAQSDTGDTPCSSCARSSIRCLFSRVPQKRGPSKGYIKELADRINSIENKLESEGGLSQEEIDRLFGSDRQRAGPNGSLPAEESGRKRPFSSISSAEITTPVANRTAPWGSEPRSLQPASAQSDGQNGYNNSTLAPNSSAIKDETPSKPPAASTDAEMMDHSSVPDIDEAILHEVLSTVSPMYPILPSTKTRMQELLSQCPEPVANAFVLALQAVGQSGGSDVKQASSLLHEWEDSEAPRTRGANIVHAQTLLLLIVDADWRSASTLPFLLSRAVALANTMKLWRFSAAQTLDDLDSDDLLCLRIWWSLVMMDRWYAAGTGKPAQIPDSSAVAPAGLEVVVGEICYNFIRTSFPSFTLLSSLFWGFPPFHTLSSDAKLTKQASPNYSTAFRTSSQQCQPIPPLPKRPWHPFSQTTLRTTAKTCPRTLTPRHTPWFTLDTGTAAY